LVFIHLFLYVILSFKKKAMEDSKAHISRLLTEKLTGAISAEELIIIDKLIEYNAEVTAEWEWMNAKLAARQFNAGNAEEAFNKLRPVLKPKKRPVALMAMAIAACFAGAIAIGYAFFQPAHSSTPEFFAQAAIWPEDSIVMQAEKGDFLNLTAAANKRIGYGDTWLNITDSSIQIHRGKNDAAQWQTVLVPAQLTYTITLADGSVAILNSGTRIKFPLNFTGDNREVFIDGEAFFNIAADAKRPFVVRTAKTDIQVLGTRFNVNTYGQIHTSLVDGAVSTTSAKGKLFLKPGQEAVLTDTGFTMHNFDMAATVSWIEGAYYFHDVPLKDLSGILSRWFKTSVQFDNPALQNKVFSGALLKAQPLQVFLENLELSDNIHSVLKDGVVHFK
jgi:transmembrane sensor